MQLSQGREHSRQPVSPRLLLAYALLVVIALFALISRDPLLLFLDAQPWGAAILMAGLGFGAALLRLLGFIGLERRWRLMGGAGLGLGALSLMTLMLGVAGALRPMIAQAVVGTGVLLALLALRQIAGAGSQFHAGAAAVVAAGRARFSIVPSSDQLHESLRRGNWLWALFLPAAAMALAAATIPPGMSWIEEGNGYDVLEYHLAAPREYLEAGRIQFLPHNVYSNMPLGVEMLYLLTMQLAGDPEEAVLPAQFLNAALGLLAAGAVWLAARETGCRQSAHLAGAVFATCPFIVYLSGVAYVENGQLLFAALALAAFLRGRREGAIGADVALQARTPPRPPLVMREVNRWMLLSGLFAGLACGCKYTGVVMTALPIGVALLIDAARARARAWAIGAFVLGTAVTFGPWLAKNQAWTGNPVFPLATGLFGWKTGAWDAESAARWEAGHRPAAQHRSIASRLRRLSEEVFAVPKPAANGPATASLERPPWLPRFGLVAVCGTAAGIIALGLAASAARRGRSERQAICGAGGAQGPAARKAAAHAAHPSGGDSPASGAPPPALDVCWLIVACGLVAWLAASHLVDRFAVLLLPALALMMADAWRRLPQALRPAGTALAACIALVGVTISARILLANPMPYRDAGLFGRVEWMTRGEWLRSAHIPRLNALLADGRRILMVGDARRFYLGPGADYCVVFNPNPFAEAATRLAPAELIAWLRERGYDYVFVDWGEMRRLRGTYGFWESVSEGLFAGLAVVGMRPVEDFVMEEGRPPYATLFELPGG